MRQEARAAAFAVLIACMVLVGAPSAHAAAVKQRNVVDLISMSEIIAVGKVIRLTDGLDHNHIAYTEVTLNITEPIKGAPSGEYSFRQYGLLAPLDVGHGVTNLNVRIDGWPVFREGEEVMVFLYRAAELTGLRTTVGLFQGKFTVQNNEIVNAVDNRHLFNNVKLTPDVSSKGDRKLLRNVQGALPANDFISLVRRAVRERWIEEGRMSHEFD